MTLESERANTIGKVQWRRGLPLVVIVLVSLSIIWHARHMVSGGWRDARGYEFEWIAEPMSKGLGYTFADRDSWLGPYENPLTPTAWVEPVQTTVMAVAFRAFGEHGRMVLVALNYVWFAVCCVMVFQIGRRFGSPTGGAIAAVAFAAFNPGVYELRWYIGNAAIATALICIVAWMLDAMFERVSQRRSVLLGLVLGVLSLTHAGTMLFVPFAALLTFVAARRERVARPSLHGAMVLGVAAAVVLPWTMRNYVVFRELVPVRTGLGQNMAYALPAMAQTIRPDIELGPAWSSPPWTVNSSRAAMQQMLNLDRWTELNDHSMAAGRAAGPADYLSLNEAQRDDILREQSFAFIRDYPGFAAKLGIVKAHGFFWGNWSAFRLITILAAAGALLLFVIHRRAMWIMGGLIALYIVPYLLSAPIYYRYRAPIEPLFFVLGGILVGTLVDFVRRRTAHVAA